jgi:formiminotetrahydrofolate cyclodeaminase
MAAYATTSLIDVLDAFGSSDPVPGGGSAAALTGSIGVSLLLMVAGMSKTRTGSPEEVSDLAAAAARLRSIRAELVALIDEDSDAYLSVLAAYQLPKKSEADAANRRDAIEQAMRDATSSPLRTMRACEQALRDAPVIARFGNPNAITDAAVGAKLLSAALESAAMNVTVNLPGLKDETFIRTSDDERRSLLASAENLVKQAAALAQP